MWLLRAKDAILNYFVSPEHVPKNRLRENGYAILSHVWGKNEQTFQDIQALPSKCAPDQTPRDIASEKIRKACELAVREGYEWIWIDTCCIDKSSSAELSEAINSMFRYYSLAGLCFAYLEDVSSNGRAMAKDEFKKSKWHTRGWTLQELIAPKWVAFVSSSWNIIGYKDNQTRLVEEATGVPVEVLHNPKKMKKYSIAQRMSWAARRVTTREEDEAYCLLGIFDINMPTLYGEGRKAFRRMQEEIMRQSLDTTLFAWGLHYTWDDLVHPRVEDPASCEDPDYHLFATSPFEFHTCSQLRFVDPTKCLKKIRRTEQHDGYITFTSTPQGLSTVIPTFIYGKHVLGHLGWAVGRRFLFLLLRLLPTENIHSKDKLYEVGGISPIESVVNRGRLVARSIYFPHVAYAPTDVNDSLLQGTACATWKKLYLADEHVITTLKTTDTLVFDSMVPLPEPVSIYGPSSPFHLDPRSTVDFWNFKWNVIPQPTDVPWTGDPPITLELVTEFQGLGPYWLSLGVCTRPDLPVASPHRLVHWAYIDVDNDLEARHDCSKDHISNWPDRSRKYGCTEHYEQFYLSFTPFERDPERTLVLHLHTQMVDAFDNDCYIMKDYYRSHLASELAASPMPCSVYRPTTPSLSAPQSNTAERAPAVTEESGVEKTEETEGRQGHPSSDGIAPTQAGTAVQSHDLVASDAADTERPQNGTSGGDSARSPTENESRIKTGKRVMDGLRARWKSGWSRVLATRRWHWHQKKSTPERDTAEQGGVAAEVIEGTTDVRP